MKEDLERKLYLNYPDLFADKDLPMSSTRMCDGIVCDDGWYELIDETCKALTIYAKMNDDIKLKFFQIKEKFGQLRIYMSGYTDHTTDNIISNAETKSANICEVCGEGNSTIRKINGYWLKSVCDKHYEDLNKNT